MDKKRTRFGYFMLLPSAILVIILIIFPTFQTIYNSFFEYRVQTWLLGRQFIGLDNYRAILKDDVFFSTLKWTLQFVFFTVTIETVIGILLALLMNRKMPGQGIIRAAILIPWAIPTLVAGIIWQSFFAQNGIINGLLYKFGLINEYIPWLTETFSAKFAIIFADIWKTTPYMSLLILAGLQTISKSLYEAADIDGATKFQQLFKITLPVIKKSLMITVLFKAIKAIRVYDIVAAMTSGGPAGTTQTLSTYAVNTYFTHGNIGYGSAISTVMLLIAIVVCLLFSSLIQSKLED